MCHDNLYTVDHHFSKFIDSWCSNLHAYRNLFKCSNNMQTVNKTL